MRDKYESLLNQLGRAVRGKVDRAEVFFMHWWMYVVMYNAGNNLVKYYVILSYSHFSFM